MAGARFCAETALELARTGVEWADAQDARAMALEDPAQSFHGFSAIADRFLNSVDPHLQRRVASALVNKGIMLSRLNRREEAIAVFDDVVGQFGTASEASFRAVVERATELRARLSSDRRAD